MRHRGGPIPEPKELLDCVSFLLLKGDQFLVEKRRMDKPVDPGAIAIPGGHMDPGESQLDALRRELMEELAITPSGPQFLCTLLHRAEEFQRLHYYLVDHWSGAIENNEAEEILWLSFADLDRLDLAVDRVAIGEYQRIFRNR